MGVPRAKGNAIRDSVLAPPPRVALLVSVRWCIRILFIALGLAVMPASRASGDADALREWVRAEKTLAAEQAAWREEEAVLEDLIALLDREAADLEADLTALRVSQPDPGKLAAREAALEARLAEWETILAPVEAALSRQASRWPAPLSRAVASRLTHLATPGANLPAPRLGACLEILSEAERFHAQVTLDVGSLDADGRTWETREVWFGLAGGYWTTVDGRYAGVFSLGPDGWERLSHPGLASSVSVLAAIAGRERSADYVTLPVVAR